jgi:hypothetical protein
MTKAVEANDPRSVLADDRKVPINWRLNKMGVQGFKRMLKDKRVGQPEYTGFGFKGHLNGEGKVIKVKGKEIRKPRNPFELQQEVQNWWKGVTQVNNRRYNGIILKMYSELDKISDRSTFIASEYWKMWASYGRNADKGIPVPLVSKISELCEKFLGKWLDAEDRSMEQMLLDGEWLHHIHEGKNSGAFKFTAQTRDMAVRTSASSVKMIKRYKKERNKFKFSKCPFATGARTERKRKQRGIAQAALKEKIVSANINASLDKHIEKIGFKMPRHYGSLDNLCKALIAEKSPNEYYLSKDFSGFDASIPLVLFRSIVEWLQSKSTDLAWMLAFEVDLIIHSVLIVGEKTGYKLKALPSGIGVTQLIGSLIHAIIDELMQLDFKFVVYQSDDTMGIIVITKAEVIGAFKNIYDVFGMKLSPLGEKSILALNTGIILQTIIQGKKYYGNEIRRITNLVWRETTLNDDEDFRIMLGIAKEEDEKAKIAMHAKSYFDTIGTLGLDAPSLANIISWCYGPEEYSGFDWDMLMQVAPFVGEFEFDSYEQIKLQSKWVPELWQELRRQYGYRVIGVADVRTVLVEFRSNLERSS